MASWLLALDLGGSGSRLALQPLTGTSAPVLRNAGRAVSVGVAGSTAASVIRGLCEEAARRWPDEMSDLGAIAMGVTGVSTVARDHAGLRAAALGAGLSVPVVLASDGLAGHLGALQGASGGVIVAGTGSIAIGTDFDDVWVRSDGWGHLLSDLGAAAWIGQQGLQAALAAFDERSGGSTALLAMAEERYGAPSEWPRQLYQRDDRAGVLGGFAPSVSLAAKQADPAAEQIIDAAGRHLAQSLVAVLRPSLPAVASYNGGVFTSDDRLTASFRAHFASLHPGARLLEPVADSIGGLLALARMRAIDEEPMIHRPPFLYELSA